MALLALGRDGAGAAGALRPLLRDEDAMVRYAGAWAAEAIGAGAAELRDEVERLSGEDPDPNVRDRAKDALIAMTVQKAER